MSNGFRRDVEPSGGREFWTAKFASEEPSDRYLSSFSMSTSSSRNMRVVLPGFNTLMGLETELGHKHKKRLLVTTR